MTGGRILITGASTGIGRACALDLASLGHTVFAGVRRQTDGDALRAQAAGTLTPVPLDVTSPDSIQQAMTVIGDAPLTGLVNNAGVAVVGPLELVPVEAWRRQFDVNVLGLVALTQACLPLLRAGGGRVVNIGSVAGLVALPGSGPYDASKFALEAISDSLRMELRAWGIAVALIEPGAIATAIWEKTERLADDLSRHPDYALCAPMMARLRQEAAASARHALPPGAVVKAVRHALLAPRPRTRYRIGRESWLWSLLRQLPDRWRDWLILGRLRS